MTLSFLPFNLFLLFRVPSDHTGEKRSVMPLLYVNLVRQEEVAAGGCLRKGKGDKSILPPSEILYFWGKSTPKIKSLLTYPATSAYEADEPVG